MSRDQPSNYDHSVFCNEQPWSEALREIAHIQPTDRLAAAYGQLFAAMGLAHEIRRLRVAVDVLCNYIDATREHR